MVTWTFVISDAESVAQWFRISRARPYLIVLSSGLKWFAVASCCALVNQQQKIQSKTRKGLLGDTTWDFWNRHVQEVSEKNRKNDLDDDTRMNRHLLLNSKVS